MHAANDCWRCSISPNTIRLASHQAQRRAFAHKLCGNYAGAQTQFSRTNAIFIFNLFCGCSVLRTLLRSSILSIAKQIIISNSFPVVIVVAIWSRQTETCGAFFVSSWSPSPRWCGPHAVWLQFRFLSIHIPHIMAVSTVRS